MSLCSARRIVVRGEIPYDLIRHFRPLFKNFAKRIFVMSNLPTFSEL